MMLDLESSPPATKTEEEQTASFALILIDDSETTTKTVLDSSCKNSFPVKSHPVRTIP